MAAIQAFNAWAEDRADRRAIWEEFVVTPLNLFLSTLVILLLIAGGVLAYRRLMPVLELRLRTISSRDGTRALILMDGIRGVIHSPGRRFIPFRPNRAKLSRLSSDRTVQVEIVGPFDPSIAGWIAEAEQKLRHAGDDPQ